jgi:hypothetical protein
MVLSFLTQYSDMAFEVVSAAQRHGRFVFILQSICRFCVGLSEALDSKSMNTCT